MTEPDIRKISEIMKTHRILYDSNGTGDLVGLVKNGNEFYAGLNGFYDPVDLSYVHPSNIFVTIPLSQVRKGKQPL